MRDALNRIIPVPPPAPRVVTLPTVPPASFSPTAVTARPDRSSLEPRHEPPPPQKKAPRRRTAHRAIAVSLLLAGAGAITLTESESKPPTIVSGRASPKRSDTGASVRWWKNKVKITLDASVNDIGEGAEDAVRGAFGTWLAGGERLPRLNFDSSSKRQAVTLKPDGENRVYFAPITVPGHENDLAITLAYTRNDTGEVTEADLVLNTKHAFGVLQAPPESPTKDRDRDEDDDGKHGRSSAALSSGSTAQNCKATYDVQSVLTHEVGHFFGLGEDTTDSGATMYFSTTPCDVGKRDLSSGDSGEMSSLYASGVVNAGADGEDPEAQAAASCAMTPARANGAPAGLTLLIGLSLGWLRRRR